MGNSNMTQEKAKTTVHEAVHTDSELYKVGAVLTAAFAGAVGVWAVICLSSAFMSAGGPVVLAKNLIGAITGSM